MMFQRVMDWLSGISKADRAAIDRSERILKAFMAHDDEALRAEMVRLYGATFFATMHHQQELQRLILRDKLV